jgi:hypothetical protein
MKTWWILFLAMSVLAADSMAGGGVNCDNPYLNKDTFARCTQDGNYSGGYNNGGNYNNGNDYNNGYQQNDGYGDGNYGGDQYYQEPSYVDNRYTRVYRESYEQCNPRGNPHSYACAKATFSGELAGTNPREPSDFTINDFRMGDLRGEWIAVTYVNPSGNVGDEFYMDINRAKTTQPLGVFNVNTNSPVGSVWVGRYGLSFDNWQGQRLETNSVEILGEKTVRFIMREGNYLHQFTCRNFNRDRKYHLFCAWDVEVPGYGWVHHGYMGFLTRAVWDDFLRNSLRR